MEVILLEKVGNLGNIGEQVTVKAGYGRNYLLPQRKALSATAENIKIFESRREEFEAKTADSLTLAQKQAEKLQSVTLKISKLVSEESKLYGSVSQADISDALQQIGHEIKKTQIILPEGAIRALGEYDVTIELHGDVTASIKVEVVTE